MVNRVLISTIYKGTAVIQAIKQFSPHKVYFIIDEPADEVRKTSISMVRDLFKEQTYAEIPAKIYDITGIAKAVMEVIEKEKDSEIIVHVSEGRKTMSFGLLFAAYVCRKSVSAAYYITEETNTLIQLPLLDLKVSKQKKIILEKIRSENLDIPTLEEELGITASTLYVHLKDLRDEGFLTRDNKITEMGRIVLLDCQNQSASIKSQTKR